MTADYADGADRRSGVNNESWWERVLGKIGLMTVKRSQETTKTLADAVLAWRGRDEHTRAELRRILQAIETRALSRKIGGDAREMMAAIRRIVER